MKHSVPVHLTIVALAITVLTFGAYKKEAAIIKIKPAACDTKICALNTANSTASSKTFYPSSFLRLTNIVREN